MRFVIILLYLIFIIEGVLKAFVYSIKFSTGIFKVLYNRQAYFLDDKNLFKFFEKGVRGRKLSSKKVSPPHIIVLFYFQQTPLESAVPALEEAEEIVAALLPR